MRTGSRLLIIATSLAIAACGSDGGSAVPDAAIGGEVPDAAAPPDADPGNSIDDDGDGFSENDGDCDDSDSNVNPDAVEVCDDNIDNNCNGAIDDREPDGDGDGIGPCQGDCDDADRSVFPGQVEVPDGIDNNCDGFIDADYDSDGFAETDGDCNDSDPTVNPGAVEDCYDGTDNDCNTFIDTQEPDVDGDGFGPCAGDCDDTDINVAPDLPEIDGDGIDNNCDFLVDQDIDGDGWTVANGDCADTDPARNPSILEVCNDGIDNDCNSVVDTDCLTACDLAAATRSSVGCVYYAVDTNPIHSFVAGDYAVAISNIDLTTAANVVVEVRNGATWQPVAGASFSVAPLTLQSRVLPHRYIAGSTVYAGGAYRITSDSPVVAYQFNPLDGSSSFLSDASLLLPRSSLDKFYILPAWPYGPADQSNSGHPAHVQIAASAATTVTVTSPVVTIAGGVGVPALQPNVPQVFTLNGEGDYLQLTVQNLNDSLNGLYIRADQPVAVFSSNDCANVPASASFCCCEHLEEQIVGLQTWGRSYVGSRVPVRGAEPAVWQVMAQEDNTSVTFAYNAQVTGLPASVTLNARQMAQYQVGGTAANPGDFLVSADKPIMVTQYMVGAFMVQSGGSNGDPSMVQAVPQEQYLDKYVVLVPNTWQNDFLVLTRTVGETVAIDGTNLTAGWTRVGTSSFEVVRAPVPDGVHVLTGSAPFGVIVVGYDQFDSYAYPGGLNQAIINPVN